MPKKSYAIMGATGHVGRALAEKLLEKGHVVRALGRDGTKLSALEAKGAKALAPAFDDAHALAEAFRGADGVFVMIPPSYGEDDFSAYQDRIGEAVTEALVSSGVKYAVDLSSFGAEHPSGTGPIAGLYRMEQILNRLSHVNVLHLRAASFMENHYWSVPIIRMNGVNLATAPGNIPMPAVAAGDIGEKAGDFLDKLSFKGHEVFDFTGPREYTFSEATTALGKAIGKPDLAYVQIPYEAARKAMLGNGMKSAMVDLMVEMYQAGNEGKIRPTQELTAEHRGKTTIEEFALGFASIYVRA
jgi:uncharacterized protein YbjT (DUF2867 family)